MKTRFEETASKCAICLGSIKIQGTINSCSHDFCFECIEKWSKTQNTCPLCIKRFNKIKPIPKRRIYNEPKTLIEIEVPSKDQNTTFLSIAEYLFRLGFVQGRDFIFITHTRQTSQDA